MNSIAMAVIVGTLAWISTGAPTSGPVSSRQKAESELLQLHLGELEAHRNANVEALLVNAQDGFVYVRDGKISRTNVSDTRESFRKSFKDTTYFLYEDIEPPIVRASEDGKLGWVIGRLRGRRSQKDSATGKDNSEDFVYAGIMTYELKGGKWYRVSNVSTFEPTP
jgi:hypothetical protein